MDCKKCCKYFAEFLRNQGKHPVGPNGRKEKTQHTDTD